MCSVTVPIVAAAAVAASLTNEERFELATWLCTVPQCVPQPDNTVVLSTVRTVTLSCGMMPSVSGLYVWQAGPLLPEIVCFLVLNPMSLVWLPNGH